MYIKLSFLKSVIRKMLNESNELDDSVSDITDIDLESAQETLLRITKSVLNKCHELSAIKHKNNVITCKNVASNEHALVSIVESDPNFEVVAYNLTPPLSAEKLVAWILFLAIKYDNIIRSTKFYTTNDYIIKTDDFGQNENAKNEYIVNDKVFHVKCCKQFNDDILNLISHDLATIIESKQTHGNMREDVKTFFEEAVIDVFKIFKEDKININNIDTSYKNEKIDALINKYKKFNKFQLIDVYRKKQILSDIFNIPSEFLIEIMDVDAYGGLNEYEMLFDLYSLTENDLYYIKHGGNHVIDSEIFYGIEDYHTKVIDDETGEVSYKYIKPEDREMYIVKVPSKKQAAFITDHFYGDSTMTQVGGY